MMTATAHLKPAGDVAVRHPPSKRDTILILVCAKLVMSLRSADSFEAPEGDCQLRNHSGQRRDARDA